MEKNFKKSINAEGGNVRRGWIFFFKISKRDFTFIRKMGVHMYFMLFWILLTNLVLILAPTFKHGTKKRRKKICEQ